MFFHNIMCILSQFSKNYNVPDIVQAFVFGLIGKNPLQPLKYNPFFPLGKSNLYNLKLKRTFPN
uniref:Uncharacterized protein n=1 Tax=Meloidogyne incognita TaxID=6306 RepID=A0A914KNM3_MELIC